ncbi:22122_t:CDS:2, partial [Gigaspora rosea]
DEAFGYLKRVIVTLTAYPHLVKFLHFDIQSTGQKSGFYNTILIRQSDFSSKDSNTSCPMPVPKAY